MPDEFPGRIIKIGEADGGIVRTIVQKLNARGYVTTSPAGLFDNALKSVVRLYQSQNRDALGRVLEVDGEVGPMTWGSLFGVAPVSPAVSGLSAAALQVAIGEIGVMEDPIGSNGGQRVNEYLRSTGLGTGFFWCMAFVHFCFAEAARDRGVPNPFPRTAGVLDAWNRSSAFRITKATALANPSRVGPGAVFIYDYNNGMGHTGFVRANVGGGLTTVEGNTNPDGSNNGIGVFEMNRRNLANSLMKGFILVP